MEGPAVSLPVLTQTHPGLGSCLATGPLGLASAIKQPMPVGLAYCSYLYLNETDTRKFVVSGDKMLQSESIW